MNIKPAAVILGVFVVSVSLWGQDVSVGLNGGYFHPADQALRDIYCGGLTAGLGVGLPVGNRLEGWLEGRWFSRRGELSLTRETVRLTLVPVQAGLGIRLLDGPVRPMLGVGLTAVVFREEAPLEVLSKVELGVFFQARVLVRLGRRLHLETKIDYSTCTMDFPEAAGIECGGLSAMTGIRLSLGKK